MQNEGEDASGMPFPALLPNPEFSSFFDNHSQLVEELARFDPAKLIPIVGGLLTSPDWQASTLRLEVLQHLAVANAQGAKNPKPANFKAWLIELGAGVAGRMEDPSEDVFVSRVILPDRDCLIFEGIYEAAGHVWVRAAGTPGTRASDPSVGPSNRLTHCILQRVVSDIAPHGHD